uniref:Adaptin_N domain-containing protein n=1 Tax=Elaeophora elaphi TaxID=1147741 RepID=A0A158Q7G9_9BILA
MRGLSSLYKGKHLRDIWRNVREEFTKEKVKLHVYFSLVRLMALRKVRSNLDRFFDKSLTDLIRGIRNNKDNEARYIAACIHEIKMELRQDSVFVKANAIEKLAYLQMMGYDISWASFNIIEVMASTKFTEKRIGYMAASQCFHDGTDVLMLTTNLIRKDLHSAIMYETGIALGAFSCFVTLDLARDLTSDVVNLLSSSRPYVRKRCVLLLYKIFLKYPDSLRPTFPRLKEKLEDPDPGVQSAAVNVICELARKNPKNYLTLAPVFFKLMTTSSNNWMLIKIIKLFGALVPLEPRLGKKLLEPLTNLINRLVLFIFVIALGVNSALCLLKITVIKNLSIQEMTIFSTSAMSLLYECINTVIAVLISISSGVPGDHTASIQLCVQKLGVLIEDSDQNLKYLGLLAMGKILQTHPKAVQAHKDIVLRCLDDRDESIRLRALDLLYGMVSKRNIMEIVRKLMDHVDAAEGSYYRDELLSRIIAICSYNNYQYITNFEWYISVLVELTKVEGTKHGTMIAEQMLDVSVRVQSIRHFSVSQMALLVENAHLLLAGSAQHRSNMCEVLLAAAWICGEYCEHLCNVQGVLEAMLKAKIPIMPGHILSVYMQNIAKLYAVLLTRAEADNDWDGIDSLDNLVLSKLPQFVLADHLEAQERACTFLAVLKIIERFHSNHEKIGEDFAKLFEGELNPVAAKAQKKVPVPEGLDLDAWIHEPDLEDEASESENENAFGNPALRPEFTGFGGPPRYTSDEDRDCGGKLSKTKERNDELSEEELQKRLKQRQAEIENNPYYMKGEIKMSASKRLPRTPLGTVEKPGSTPDLQSPLEIPGVVGLNRYMEQQQSTLTWKTAKKEKKKVKGKKNKISKEISSSDDDDIPVIHQVNRGEGEMPENAKSTDEEEVTGNENEMEEIYKALDINLEEPLKADERVEVPHAYTQPRPRALDLFGYSRTETAKAADSFQSYNDTSLLERSEKKKKKVRRTGCKAQREKRESRRKDLNGSGTHQSDVICTEKWLNNVETKDAATKALKKGSKSSAKKSDSKIVNGKKKNVIEEPIDKDVYEAASGICTPSNPNLHFGSSSSNGALTPHEDSSLYHAKEQVAKLRLSSYRILGETEDLKLTYETRVSTDDANQIAIGIVFLNKGHGTLRNLEMNVLDTINTRLLREEGKSSMAGIPLSFQLPAGVSAEHVFRFSVKAINMPQKLRGNLTFFVDRKNETIHDKLDFHILMPAVSFLVPATITSESYDMLLSSNDMGYKSSAQIIASLPWNAILKKICFFAHFNVVKQNDTVAALYAHTIKAESVCILIKQQGDKIQIDGRCGDQQLIYAIVDELRDIVSS